MSAIRLKRKSVSLLFALLLIIGSVFPAFADEVDPGANNDIFVKASEEIEITPAEKIEKEVSSLLDEEESIEVIVSLQDGFDAQRFKQQAVDRHATRMTPYEMRRAIRRELVVELQDYAKQSQYGLLELLKNRGTEVEEYEDYHIANVVYVKAKPSVIKEIAELPEVRKISENSIIYNETPVDFQRVRSLQDQEVLWHLEMVKADQVWGMGFKGEGVVVANIDSGVDGTHPALKKSWRGYSEDGHHNPKGNWLDTVEGHKFPIDSDTHGTHVMGTMVGHDPEAGVITGVAPNAQWIAVRVFDEMGRTTDRRLLDAAEWILAPGGDPDKAPDVVNNSWGGGSSMDDWYLESVQNWITADIFPAFAAGNRHTGEPLPEPGSIMNPAHYEESYAVAAIDREMLRASFSKRGPSPYTEGWKPNISAPGVGVYSTLANGHYGSASGTSMACPHVSGVVALMRSINHNISVEELIHHFNDTAHPLTDDDPHAQTSPNHDYGYGLINAYDSALRIVGGSGVLEGEVLQAGEDAEKPVIVHEQEVNEVYAGNSIKIDANVTDEISVLDVKLLVNPGNHEIPMSQVSGDHTGGSYSATMTEEHLQVGTVTYQIQAKDYGGNVVNSADFSVDVKFGVTPGHYVESFEGEAEGWKMDPLWQVGKTSHEHEPEAFEGEQVVGTKLGKKLGEKEDGYLVSAPIDMRGVNEASARFFNWRSLGSGMTDVLYGKVYLTNDDGEHLQEVRTLHGRSDGWESVIVDLSEYANSETPVFVVFRLFANSHNTDLGWYLDKFTIEGEDKEAPVAPADLTAKAGLNGIHLKWSASKDADFKEYNVYRSLTADELGGQIATVNVPSYIDPHSELEDDTTYYYSVKAVDFAGNVSAASNQAPAKKNNAVTLALYDFEADDGGFVPGALAKVSGHAWEWGEVGSNHGPRGAKSGTKLWATGLSREYGNNQKGYLDTPAQTLDADGSYYLRFAHWYSFEQSYYTGADKWDWAKVKISTDGETWEDITPGNDKLIGGESAIWLAETIDITKYAGKTVQIRFYYQTDMMGELAGWFIDDVEFIKVPTETTAYVEETTPLQATEAVVYDEGVVASFDMSRFQAQDEADNAEPVEITVQEIPIPFATVTVLESGVTVKNDPRTGKYRIRHMASEEGETWTLKAEAYGYEPKIFESELGKEASVEHDFLLAPKALGSIRGNVRDRYFADEAAGAVVRIVEDPNIAPVVADENGNFHIPNVYVGEYTLHASADGFESGTAKVTVVADEEAKADILLKRFVASPDEIIYEDGRGEEGITLKEPEKGVATLFTPTTYGKVLSARVFLWGEQWPIPGGNEIGVGLFLKEGNRWVQKGETIVRDDIERGAWNTFDLSHLQVTTDQDFMISTIQTKVGNESPGVGVDENNSNARSHLYDGENFLPFETQGTIGAVMIRAHLEYDAESPIITNLEETNHVTLDDVVVEGTVSTADAPVLIYLNDKPATTIPAEEIEDGRFRTTVSLPEEVNTVRASVEVNGVETEPGDVKTIIKDQVKPELTVTTPESEVYVNVELVHVAGTTTDKYFEKLLVNGEELEVAEDGTFATKIIVTEGENTVTVQSFDKAGNVSEHDCKVHVDLGGAVAITEMLPDQDVSVKAGESVKVAFTAPAGGKASYLIAPSIATANIEGISMKEETPGRYTAVWTAPENMQIDRADVHFRFVDQHGNQTSAVAPGKITVTVPEPIVEINLTEMLPDKDVSVKAGESVQLAFTGPIGGKASYLIAPSFTTASIEGIPMKEETPGRYTAVWTAPENMQIDKAEVHFLFTDAEGNPANTTAPGKITVTVAEPIVEINLTEMLPDKDVSVKAGESVNVAFTGPAGGKASYLIAPSFTTASIEGISMKEETPGRYTAVWTAPENMQIDKAEVHFLFTDAEGNPAEATAPGKITITTSAEKEAAVERIAGETRYDTAVRMSKETFDKADVVVIASGENFPDALVGGAFAEEKDAPVLLTKKADVQENVLAEIKRLEAKKAVVLGGTGSVGEVVVEALEKEGLDVRRIAGEDRYETAVRISDEARDEASKHVFIISGENYADVLSIAPAAAMRNDAILMSEQGSVPKVTMDALKAWKVEKITLIGGERSLSEDVMKQLEAENITVERVSGSTRYHTNICIAGDYFEDVDEILASSGEDYPDALVGSVYSAKKGAPTILINDKGLTDPTIDYLEATPIEKVVILGGTKWIPEKLKKQIETFIN